MEAQSEEEIKIEEKEYVVLGKKDTPHWRSFTYRLLVILSSSQVRFIFLVTVHANYILTGIAYIFLRKHMSNTVYSIILTFDILYIVRYLMEAIVFFWKTAQLDLNIRPKSKVIIILDFFFAFPYSYIYEGIVGRTYKHRTFLILRSFVFLRLIHPVLYMNEQFRIAGTQHVKVFVVQFVLFVILLQQTFACIFYIMVWNSEEHMSERWTLVTQLWSDFKEPMEKYIICICYVFFTITQRTFGNIVPLKSPERILIMVMTLSGFTLTTGFFIGILSFLYEVMYQRRESIRHQIYTIKKYLTTLNLSDSNKELILKYYHILWEKKNGVHKAPPYPEIPFSVKSDIAVDINIGPLQRSVIFRDKPDAFLRALSCLMKHEFYLAEEFIYHANIVKDKMIFVVSGIIQVLSDEDNESSIIKFGTGTCLGEASLILTLSSRCVVKAACYTELQVLYRKDFSTLIDRYPEIYSSIQKSVMQRIKKARVKISLEERITRMNLHSYYTHSEAKATIKILKSKLRGQVLKTNEDQYLTMYKLDDGSIPSETGRIFLTLNFPLILLPFTILLKAWEVIIIIVASFIAIFYPYFAIFVRNPSSFLLTTYKYIDIILMLDVVIILHTAIKEKNITIKSFILIMRKLVTQPGFYLDFVSCIKFEALCLPFQNKEPLKCEIWRLNRLLKVYRVPKLINTIDLLLKGHVFTLRLIKYLMYILISLYWFGALLFAVSCVNFKCTEDGWYFTKVRRDILNGLVFSYSRIPILTSLYYSMHYVTSPSYNDIVAYNILDRIMGYIATAFGVAVLGYCIAELTATITRRRKIVTKYQENLFALKHFLKEKNMSKDIIQRVENFFVVQWDYDEGASMEGSLFYNANQNIRTMVEMAEKWDVIINLPIFKGRNYDFLQHIVMEASTVILPPGEVIHYKNEINEILYIIQDGYCVRQSEKGQEVQTPFSYFGSVSLFAGGKSITTVKAFTNVKMLCIPHNALWKCASMFPMVTKQLNETIASLDLTEDLKRGMAVEYSEAEEHINDFQGSIVNVLKYCRKHNESYGEPFRRLSYMRWIQFILLPICILPDGIFLKAWMAMRLVVAAMVALITPYALIEYPHTTRELQILLWVFDVVAYVDLYVMMFVGFYGPKKQLIIHPLKTAENYLKGKFLLDLIFCFPWDTFAMLVDDKLEDERLETNTDFVHTHAFIFIVRIVRVLQIYRLPQFFNYLSSDITRASNIFQIIKFFPTIIITVNFCATILIHTTCRYLSKNEFTSEMFSENGTYVQPPGLMKHPVMDHGMFCKVQSWVDRSDYRNITDPFTLYMVAIYFCTSTVTTCGFGDITPHYPNNLILSVLMITFGILLFGFIYAKISSHKADWRTFQLEQQAIVWELKHFMVTENVSKELKEKIMDRLEYAWKRTRGAEPNEMLSSVNDSLHEDAVLSIYEQILSEMPIFKNIDRSFFRVIGKIIGESYYLKEEVICEIDDIVPNICVVYRGTVKITRKDNPNDIYMGRGGMFGNLSSAPLHKISITVTPVTKTDLVIFNSYTFFTIVKKYPEIYAQVQRIITNTDFLSPETQEDYNVHVLQEITEKEKNDTTIDNFRNNCWSCFQIISCWKVFRTSIPPQSFIYNFIDLTCLGLVYINCLFVTYEFSFRHHNLVLLIKSVIIDVIFLIRLLLAMHKSYTNDFGELVVSNKLILQRYFRGKRLRRTVDIVTNIPFYYFILVLPVKDPYLYFSGFRLITICRFLNFLDYYDDKADHLFANTFLLKIITTIIWVTMAIHIFACGWYLCACPLISCNENGWTVTHLENDRDKPHIYLTCIYVMTGLFTAATSGDILPHTFTEQIYLTIVMILSNFLIGIFIGDVINALNSLTLTRVKYELGIKRLELYLKNCNVSDFQMEKLTTYVQELWLGNDGNQTPRAFGQLHFKTRHELITAVYGHHLKKAYIFKDVEEAFIRQLTSFLTRNVFFTGNYIVKHGDSDKSMYFIHLGEVDILTVHPNLTETVHEVLKAGEVFGIVQGLHPGVAHHFSYRARTTIHAISLCFTDWEHLLNFFPNSKEAIYRNVNVVYT